MVQITPLHRILFLLSAIISAYGLVHFRAANLFTDVYITISFGIITLSSTLLLLMGFEILENRSVMLVSSLLPLGFTLGIASIFLPKLNLILFSVVLVIVILLIINKLFFDIKRSYSLIILIHGISGFFIVFFPFFLWFDERAPLIILLISIGGMLSSVGGLQLSALRFNPEFITKEKVYHFIPFITLLSAISFVVGFSSI